MCKALIDGAVRRVRVCARCLRSGKVQKPPVRTGRREAAPQQAKACSSSEPRSPAAGPALGSGQLGVRRASNAPASRRVTSRHSRQVRAAP